MRIHEAEKLLKDLPRKFDVFPSLAGIDVLIPDYAKPIFKPHPVQERLWQSKQAPGTPASVEALFILIKNGQHESKAFKFNKNAMKVSDDDLWAWYEEWTKGRVHPDVEKRRHKLLANWREAIQLRDANG